MSSETCPQSVVSLVCCIIYKLQRIRIRILCVRAVICVFHRGMPTPSLSNVMSGASRCVWVCWCFRTRLRSISRFEESRSVVRRDWERDIFPQRWIPFGPSFRAKGCCAVRCMQITCAHRFQSRIAILWAKKTTMTTTTMTVSSSTGDVNNVDNHEMGL